MRKRGSDEVFCASKGGKEIRQSFNEQRNCDVGSPSTNESRREDEEQ